MAQAGTSTRVSRIMADICRPPVLHAIRIPPASCLSGMVLTPGTLFHGSTLWPHCSRFATSAPFPEHKRCRGLQCQKKSPSLHHSSFSALDFPGVIDSYPAVGEPRFAEHFSSDEVMAYFSPLSRGPEAGKSGRSPAFEMIDEGE